MPNKALHAPAKLFIVAALALALTACGTASRTVCNDPPASSSSSPACTCGSDAEACPIQPGPEFLYATTSGGQILAFSIGQNNTALTSIGSVSGPAMSLGLAAVDNQFLYASDPQNAQIDGFSIDQTTGVLTALAGSPFGTLSVPGVLAAPPGEMGSGSSFLYAADSGTVDTFTVSTAGAPTPVSGSPSVPEAGFSITVDPIAGRFLYAADDDPPGGIFAFTTDTAEGLSAVSGSPFTIPGQTVANSLPAGIADSGGSYVYAALSLTNQIAAFSIMSSGALTPVPGSPFSSGATPTSVVVASNFLYAINSSDGTLSGYSIDSTNGVLTPLSGSPFAIAGVSLATDYFGGTLYVAGSTGIQAFSIGAGGALTPESGSPFPASGATLLTVVQIPPP